ncbi:hypothetical protein LDENG_00173600 [Lucifuga dentata]|nr:hypothetical protein LDENG_00173600 [Lucifuga dentata]
MVSLSPTRVYLDRPNRFLKIMLKVIKALIHNGNRIMEAYAILDDGSERTIVLSPAVQQLKLRGSPEILPPADKHTYPVAALQQKYLPLRGLPIPTVVCTQPLLCIGSDLPHPLVPVQPVCKGPPGGPTAICTQLGWSLQGPIFPFQTPHGEQQCLHTFTATEHSELLHHVECLWQLDTLPCKEKVDTRSKQDQQAYNLLQASTVQGELDGVQHYATPLWCTPIVNLHTPKEAVLSSLHSTELRLDKSAESYCSEIHKLEQAGHVAKISPEETSKTLDFWFIPHHRGNHNGKDQIVFNCSFQHQGQSLNDQLLPGLMPGPSLLGVL